MLLTAVRFQACTFHLDGWSASAVGFKRINLATHSPTVHSGVSEKKEALCATTFNPPQLSFLS
jgi:hypothetical protein